ncbi:MAG TPA: lamin tail domain-containing protein, partial [Candidatus Eisenbacteria bacterium]|nr:lamin tail domain-containing protein [Candidatus Eisenbacteria bacterium]
DPRLVGGGLASWALPYTEPLTLTNHTLVRARVRSSTSTIWSAVVEAEFFTPQDFAALQLNEIHYNPPMFGGVDGERFEFLELRNTGPATLDLSGLEFAAGVNFVFTNGARLAPGAFCVLVNSASNFATLFTNTPIHGVFGGKLDNGGETLTLNHPLGFTVFSVAYDDVPPWPTAADGTGFSLQRTNTRTNANDPANWTAAVPTPGSPAAPELIDTDADGLPDIWEQVHGTDLNVPDANEDPDHDGMTNLQEFLAGTDPNDPSSGLRITGAALDPTATAIVLTFEAVSDRTYTVQWRTNANAGAWQSLQNIPAAATRQTVRVTNALTADEAGFYRLVTPAIP